jgi:hypothetical protein
MNAIESTIFGFSLIFLMTSLGSAILFFFRKWSNESVSSTVFGFAACVMGQLPVGAT